MLFSISFECIEFVGYLYINVFIYAASFTAFCFNNPYRAIIHFDDIIGIEQPLVTEPIDIYYREILQ